MISFKAFLKFFGPSDKSGLCKDPVCGMKASNAISSSYQGINYSFCSDNCQQQFEESPESYIRK